MPALIRTFTLLSLVAGSIAQDLGVPTSWREFSNKYDQATLISNSQAGIDQMVGQLDSSTGQFNGIGWWQSGNALSAMANQDHFVGTNVNQANVVNSLNTGWSQNANYDPYGYNDDAQWWATAAYYGYRAYEDSGLLSNAVAVWNRVNGYVITQDQANAGSQPNKNFAIEGTCNGQSMAGAVFWRSTIDDQSVNSITTGLFVTLSAFLAEATGDSTYTNAAILSANWLRNHQINSDGILLDSVNAADCTTSASTWLFTYNSGKFIEGLAVLADVTGDSQWSDLYTNIANSAVKSTAWGGSDGVCTEGVSPDSNNDGVGFKAVFVRGLHEAKIRTTNSALGTLIHSYLDVQYNAILELAATGATYSSAWEGPPQSFTSWGQLAALDVLVANVDTNN